MNTRLLAESVSDKEAARVRDFLEPLLVLSLKNLVSGGGGPGTLSARIGQYLQIEFLRYCGALRI